MTNKKPSPPHAAALAKARQDCHELDCKLAATIRDLSQAEARIRELEKATGRKANASYFVLDLANDRHALAALEAYSEACSWDQPLLADELNDMLAWLSMHRRCTPLRRKVEGKPGGEEVKCDKPAVIPLGNGCWFCTEHAVDFHVRCHELGKRSVESLKRRGVEVPPGRKLT